MKKALRALTVLSVAVMACGLGPLQAQANSKYAGIVIDAKTGKVLYSNSANARRYPASTTKIMTLYILFEELEAGRVTLGTKFKASANAAAEAPSKIGLKAGQTLSVKDAIGALVTKSANDVATMVAENIEGSEAAFARRMTSTAHRLGMKSTQFRNAHGLPNSKQHTTARDLATLGRAIQDHFPKYYKYFSMRSYSVRGRRYGNHNKLLGHVKGVDGIKTGYTRASGFNLVTSVRHRNRHIVAVVLGGRTGRSRDAQMKKLITAYLPKASTGKRTAPLMAGRASRYVAIANAPLPTAKPAIQLAKAPTAVPIAAPELAVASAAPAIPPVPPRPNEISQGDNGELTVASIGTIPTPTARIAAAHSIGLGATSKGPLRLDSLTVAPKRQPMPGEAPASNGKPRDMLLAMAPPANIPGAAERAVDQLATRTPVTVQPQPPIQAGAVLPLTTGSTKNTASMPVKPVRTTTITVAANTPAPQAAKPTPPSGWQVQIAAAESEEGALDLLKQAKAKAGAALAGSALYTETVNASGATLYRARFVGFNSKASAKAACRSLKKAKFACYHLHP